MEKFNGIYVGLDVHKVTIAVAVVRGVRSQAQYFGEIANTPAEIKKLVKRLSPEGEVMNFCYEAGACGYEVYHQLKKLGQDCDVVAPSLIPRKAGERIKTDRRDAMMLAKLHSSGDLTAVWVPDKEQEGIRDLSRAREDMMQMQTKARQRLGAFLLRHGKIFQGKSRWTQAHWRWMEEITFETAMQHIVLQEYIEAAKDLERRVQCLEGQIRLAMTGWNLEPVVKALMALRGVGMLTAVATIAELGDPERADGLLRFGAQRALQRRQQTPGRDHQNGQQPRSPHAGGVCLELPLCGKKNARHTKTRRANQRESAGDRVGRAKEAVRALSKAAPCGQGQTASDNGSGARTPGLHLGYCM